MSYSVTYDAEAGFIAIVIKGMIDLSMSRQVASEAARLMQEHDCCLVLNDAREATTTLSITEIYDLPKIFSEVLSESGVQVQRLKRALVVPEAMNDFVFFETISRYRSQNVMLFRDVVDAKKWLCGKEGRLT